MKNNVLISGFLIFITSITFHSCEKEEMENINNDNTTKKVELSQTLISKSPFEDINNDFNPDIYGFNPSYDPLKDSTLFISFVWTFNSDSTGTVNGFQTLEDTTKKEFDFYWHRKDSINISIHIPVLDSIPDCIDKFEFDWKLDNIKNDTIKIYEYSSPWRISDVCPFEIIEQPIELISK